MASSKNEINKLAQDVNDSLDRLYIDTYKTNPTNYLDLMGIKNRAFNSLKQIVANNIDTGGVAAYSHIISRLSNSSSSSKASYDKSNLNSILSDTELGSLISSEVTGSIVAYDNEIDTICEYMPILSEAIDCKSEHVLSADQFSKDYLIVTNQSAADEFSDRISSLKDKYNLLDRVENIYKNTSKYGETFLYIAPYNEEIKKLLKNKKESQIGGKKNAGFDTAKSTNGIITETFSHSNPKKGKKSLDNNVLPYDINVTFNYTGIIESEVTHMIGIEESVQLSSGINNMINESWSGTKSSKKKKRKSLIREDNTILKQSNIEQINGIPGAIVKQLDRSKVVPLYINNDYCFGYYYFENNSASVSSGTQIGDGGSIFPNGLTRPLQMTPMSSKATNDMTGKNLQNVLKNIADKIAEKITPKFIVDNQDLKYEIFNILEYISNGEMINNLNVTYISPEYMEHIYWEKDSNNRGISDLARSLVPAKLYIGLYTGNVIGILTRGFDKRVYYVKNTVDTNISQTMLSTINIIKSGNKGMRDFNNIHNIIQSSGRFNDLLIPTSKTGESPIDFSIMEGQNIDTKESLMEQLEHMAVSPTGVPYEYIVSRKSVDYAIRLTMSNGKFLKDCVKRQSMYEPFLKRIITKIYNYEYLNNDILDVKLPPPAYLSILNASQMIDNVKSMVENISDMVITEEMPDNVVKTIKKRIAIRHLSGYIDFDKIDDDISYAKVLTSDGMSEPDGEDDNSSDDY